MTINNQWCILRQRSMIIFSDKTNRELDENNMGKFSIKSNNQFKYKWNLPNIYDTWCKNKVIKD